MATTTARHVLIAGYYGFGNTGDEAILAAMLQDLRLVVPEARFLVTSGSPTATASTHDVEAIQWNDIPAVVEAARRSDLILIGGGGLFHDYWGFEPQNLFSRHYYGISTLATVALLATLLDKPLMVYAVGVGPLLSKESQVHTRAIFEQAHAATVRDLESGQLLESIGVAPGSIEVTADPAFRLGPPPGDRGRVLIAAEGLPSPGRPLVGVVVRQWEIGVAKDWPLAVGAALDGFLERHRGHAVLLPFQRLGGHLTDDAAAARRVVAGMRHPERTLLLGRDYSYRDQAAILAACDLVLGMRLHSIILAARAGVPVVALAYSRKVRSVMRRLGCEDLTLDLNQITPAALTGLLKEVSARGEAWAARVSGKAEDLSRRAGRDCHLVREVLAGERARRPHLSTATLTLFKEVALGLALGAEEKRRVATELVAQRDGLEAERDRLRVLCEELARQHGDHLGQLEAWIDASVSGRSALQEQVRNLERDQRHLSEESALRAARIEELLARVSDMSDERAALVERTRRLERRSQRLREERRRLREESTGHVDRIAELIADRQQLNSERDRARADWQQLAAEKDLMSRALAELTDTRGFRLLQGYWRLRKRLAEAAKLPRSMKPWALSERRRRGGHALVFDRYKRLRKASCGADLSGVVAPGEPGLVSILLLACHNAELTREALDSLLSQSYERFELLALQDRPTSELKTLLRDYAARDPRIRIVDREHPDLPPSFWRGTDRARGELWTWLREGCRPRPDFLERMVACLERHPAWDVAYAEVGRVHERDEGVGFLARSRVAWLQGCEPPCSAAAEHDYWMEIRELFAVRRVDFADVVPERRTGSRPSTALHGEPEMSRSGAERLVFDDFRRDFCLSPMIWWLEDDAGKRSQALRRRLERRIAGAAHQLWNVNARDPSRLPRLWLPLVYVRLAEGAAAAAPVPKGLPGSALRVLVSGAQQQPETGQAAWDLCVTAANGASPPAPEGGRDWLRIRGPRQLFAALDIRARSHSTALLAAELREPRAPELAVSVIICTYRRSERLAKAIESVARQSLPRSSYEVVIVVNGPQDSELRAKIDELRQQHFADHPHNFRPILCPILGLSHARNAGISEARGKILSFLDDDAIASADWLERVCEAFDRFPRAGVVGGHIILTPPEPRPWVLSDGWERYWSHFVTGHREATTVQHWWEFPWGANWSARRQALLEIGGFRCRYGRRGNDFSGGEEIVAASLIQRLGYEIAVAPAATVLHDVEPSRYSFRHVRRTIIAGTMVNYQCQRDLYIPMGATVRDTLRRLISFDVDRTVSANSSLVRVRHWLYRKEALSRLLLAQLRTYLARLLGPVVEKG